MHTAPTTTSETATTGVARDDQATPPVPAPAGAGAGLVDTERLLAHVSEIYTQVASNPDADYHFELGRPLAERLGYAPELLDRIPAEAIESFAGVGYALDLAALEPGELVLDLGSGSGTDAFCAARLVGPKGSVTGVDVTAAQVAKARALAARDGFANVRFAEGRLETPPVAPGSVDVVISNGVINLCPDKEAAFRAAARALRPGGRLAMADIVSSRELIRRTRSNAELWAACVAGAIPKERELAAIEAAGLRLVEVREHPEYRFVSERAARTCAKYGVVSISLLAEKG